MLGTKHFHRCVTRYTKRLRIWEMNFGRDAGWIIERHGQAIAVLSDPRGNMLWCSYAIEIVTDDPELIRKMTTIAFWDYFKTEGVVWRNKLFGDVAEYAFPAINPFPEPGRLMMGYLYLAIGHPSLFDRIVLWFRKRRRPPAAV